MWLLLLSNVFSSIKFVRANWQLYLIVSLAIGNIVGFAGWDHTAQVLKVERTTHKTDTQSYKDAQAKANADARAQEEQIIQESKVRANAADKSYSDLLAKYRINLLRYQTSQGNPKSTSEHQANDSTGQTSPSIDGPDTSAQFLTITISDAQMCATNTARLQAAHDWAIHLGDKDED